MQQEAALSAIIFAITMSVGAAQSEQAGNGSGIGSTSQTGSGAQLGTGVPSQSAGAPSTSMGPLSVQRGDQILGMNVQDHNGGTLGRLDDLVFLPNGEIGYAVLSGADGSLLYPVPWSVLQFQSHVTGGQSGAKPGTMGSGTAAGQTAITSSIDRDRLKGAPSFDKSQWPKVGDESIFTQSDVYYGANRLAGAGQADEGASAGTASNRGQVRDASSNSSSTMFRASKIRSQSVIDSAGNSVGTLGDFVIDPTQGRINYVSISTGAGGRTVAMPWESVQASRQADKDRFQTTIAAQQFQAAPQYQSGTESWKQMSDPNWINKMYSYYSVQPYWTGANAGANRAGSNGNTPGNANGRTNGGQSTGTQPRSGQPSGGQGNGGQTNGGQGSTGQKPGGDTGKVPPH